MPNFDQTGPAGQGAATGRGQGPCAGNQQQSGFWGRGFGSFGRRCCEKGRRFFQNSNVPASLEEEEKILKQRLEAVQKAKKDASKK